MSGREYIADVTYEFTAGAAMFPPSKQLVTIPCSKCGDGITSEVLKVRQDAPDTYTFDIDPEPTWDHYRRAHAPAEEIS